MKKTVTKEEYFCDFCGEKCTEKHHDVILPRKATYKPFDVTKHTETYYTSNYLDLCPKCTKKLSSIYKLIKDFCVHGRIETNRKTTTIVFENSR